MVFLFQVAKKYLREPQQILAQFKEQKDAKLFIEAKLKSDQIHEPAGKAAYCLLEGIELIQEYRAGHLPETQREEPRSGTVGSGSGFSPTPFNMSPHPPGTPPPWWHDEGKDKKE